MFGETEYGSNLTIIHRNLGALQLVLLAQRRLKNWRVNPWTDYSETWPWVNVDQFRLARLIRDCPKLTDDEKIRRYETIDLKAACFELYPATGRQTRDILHVMSILGHRSIKNTLVYTHLVNFQSDEYVCKVARSVDEAKELVEGSFEYVTDLEGMKLFRKRK